MQDQKWRKLVFSGDQLDVQENLLLLKSNPHSTIILVKIFSGTSNKPLAENLAKDLGLRLSSLEIFIFPDGEKRIRILDKVLDEDVYVVQSTSSPTDVNYMELFFIIDALKRSGAKSITAIIPYFGYQRQDHQFREGESVSVKVVAEILEKVGIDKLIALDLHSIKIEEAFNIQVSHLSALSIFAKKIRKIIGIARQPRVSHDAQLQNFKNQSLNSASLSKSRLQSESKSTFSSSESGLPRPNYTLDAKRYPLTLVSPDMGGVRRIKILSEMLNNMPYAVIEKNRDLATGVVTADKIKGEVGKRAIIVDDMISSGGTIITASDLLRKNGAEEIVVFATHPVFSEIAPKILEASGVKSVYVTDTIFVPEEKRFPKLKILSVSEMIAKTIANSKL